MAVEIDDRFFHEPLLTTPFDPPNFKKTPWRDLNTPRAFVFVGDKRSGKDVAMDNELMITTKEGFTNLYIFDGGGHEKLYTAINKNCRTKWKLVDSILEVFEKFESPELSIDFIRKQVTIPDKIFDTLLGLMISQKLLQKYQDVIKITLLGLDELDGNLLHCDCHKSYPVTVIKPPYVKYPKESLDRFNGYYFSNFAEYTEAYLKGYVTEALPIITDFTKIKKPKILIEKITPMLKIVEAPVPRGSRENVNKFLEIFTKEMLISRDEGRLLVGCDPAMYPPDHEGKLDKYTTFAVIVENLKPIADKHFIPLQLNKPRNEWSKKEKAYHKISLFVGEVRKPVPNQSMSPDAEASVSKRAFFGFMPESRHAKCFPKVNAQSLGDVLKGVNKQQDIIIVKRSSERNLGEELSWLVNAMEKAIEEQLVKWKVWKIVEGKLIKTAVSPLVKRKLITEKGLCKIAELPDNRAIVINGNNQWRMTTYNAPDWHHKSDRDEFGNDTQIQFSFDEKVANRMTETQSVSARNNGKNTKTKQSHNLEIYKKTHEIMMVSPMNYDDLHQKMIQVFDNDIDKKNILENMKPKSFGEGYRRYVKNIKNV